MDPVNFIGLMLTTLGLVIGGGKAVVKEMTKEEPPKVEQTTQEPSGAELVKEPE